MVLSWSLQQAERPRTSCKARYDFRLDEQDWDKVCWGRLPKGDARSLTHQLSRRAKWAEVLRQATTPAGGSWTPDFSPADMTPGRLQALAQLIDQEFFQGTFHRTLRRHSGRQVSYGSADLDEFYGSAVQPLGDAVMASTGRRGLPPSLVVVRPTRPCPAAPGTAPDNAGAFKHAPLDAAVAHAPAAASLAGSFGTATAGTATAEVAEGRGQGDMYAGTGGGRGGGDGGRIINATRSGTDSGGRWSWLRSFGRLGQRRWGGGGNSGGCGTAGGGAAAPSNMAAAPDGPSATYTHSKGAVVFWREVWGSASPSVGGPVRLDGVACTSRLCWLAHTLGHEMLHVLLFNMCAPHARNAPQNMSLEGHGYNFLMLNWYVLGHRGHTYDPKGWRLPPPLPYRL